VRNVGIVRFNAARQTRPQCSRVTLTNRIRKLEHSMPKSESDFLDSMFESDGGAPITGEHLMVVTAPAQSSAEIDAFAEHMKFEIWGNLLTIEVVLRLVRSLAS
jgi:hypothetical protein